MSTEEEKREEESTGPAKSSARKLDAIYKKPEVGSLYKALPSLLMSQVFGIAAYFGPRFFTWASEFMKLPPDDALSLGCVALTVSATSFPFMLGRKTSSQGQLTSQGEYRMVKCMALLYQGLILFALSVMNISLAYGLALCTLPFTLLARPVRNWCGRILLILLSLLSSPLSLLLLASVLQVTFTHQYKSPSDILVNSWNNAKDGILWTVVDWHLFSNWIYQLMALAVFPNWLMFWSILWLN